MIDLDELIAEAREQAAYLRGVSRDGSMPYSGELLGSLADALVSVRAERDAALARIAEAAKLHYEEDHECVECSFESMPDVGFRGVSVPWPCPTAVLLGLNEGEKDVS